MSDVPDYDHPDRPSTAQPPPVHIPGAASVHDLVIADLDPDDPLAALLVERRRFGLAKYGTILQVEDPARDATQDLLEEMADSIVYARRAKEQGAPGAATTYAALLALTSAAARRWYQAEQVTP